MHELTLVTIQMTRNMIRILSHSKHILKFVYREFVHICNQGNHPQISDNPGNLENI